MNIEKLEKDMREKKVEIESSVAIRQYRDYKSVSNPIYMQMIDEGLV